MKHSALMIACSLLLLSAPVYAGEYEDALALATTLESQGKYLEAAQTLEALEEEHPEDLALFLSIGRLRYSVRDYPRAELSYQRALTISKGTSTEARLGVAWSQLEQGKTGQARAGFEEVLRQDPSNLSAKRGMDSLEQRPEVQAESFTVWAGLAGGALFMAPVLARPDQRLWRLSAGAVYDRFHGGLIWRGALHTEDIPTSSSDPQSHLRYDLHGRLGLWIDRIDLSGHLLVSQDDTPLGLDALAFGAVVGLNYLGPLQLEVSYNSNDLDNALRIASGYTFKLSTLSITPGIAIQQLASDDTLLMGGLALGTQLSSLRSDLGVELGQASRPVYLSEGRFINNPERLTARAWMNLGVYVFDWFYVSAGYELQGYSGSDDSTALAHQVMLGLSTHFSPAR